MMFVDELSAQTAEKFSEKLCSNGPRQLREQIRDVSSTRHRGKLHTTYFSLKSHLQQFFKDNRSKKVTK
jgi:hypothetical protein